MASAIQPRDTDTLVVLNVTVRNRGSASSIVQNWQLAWACGDKKGINFNVPLYPIGKDDLSAKGMTMTEGAVKTGIPPGAR
jgi:hypothetical protein